MSVTLLRPYGTYASGALVTLDSDTESALVSQGFATAFTGGITVSSRTGSPDAYGSQAGTVAVVPQSGVTSTITSAVYNGPLIYPCISLGSVALTTYETNGVAQTAGTMNLTEIYVPFTQTWTGAGILNGTTVGTHKVLTALYGANGALIANSATAGVTSASASVFQNIAYTYPVTLLPGRYFVGFQYEGTTPTPRHLLAANGSNVCTGTQAGSFGTVPATLTTVPVTFTTAVGPIVQLYV